MGLITPCGCPQTLQRVFPFSLHQHITTRWFILVLSSALPLTWMGSLAFPCVRLATTQKVS